MEKRKSCRRLLGVFCVLLALGLAAETLVILHAGTAAAPGTPAFTRERVGQALLHQAPLALAILVMCVADVFFPFGGKETQQPPARMERPSPPTKAGLKRLRILRLALLLLALSLIAAGVFNGSMRDVYVKAARICTECVGLG